jgi:hypothetical protein
MCCQYASPSSAQSETVSPPRSRVTDRPSRRCLEDGGGSLIAAIAVGVRFWKPTGLELVRIEFVNPRRSSAPSLGSRGLDQSSSSRRRGV